jgi:site-specific recombinase XerD
MIPMFEILSQEMKLRNFSTRTQEVYLYYNHHFLNYIKRSSKDITHNEIKKYLLYLDEKQYSSSSINLAHNALAFYYGKILRKNISRIPFQKREQKIREILTTEEMKNLINAPQNPKHQLLIAMLYATGVRVNELTHIKLNDLNFNKKLLLVHQGKGKKDRYTILSENIIIKIQSYLQHRKNKSDYLFETRDSHITDRTVQQILKNARNKARIKKTVTPHILRHTFATHLMENNVKTEYIQQLLGHKDVRTTRIYEGITTKHLETIQSPHDNL